MYVYFQNTTYSCIWLCMFMYIVMVVTAGWPGYQYHILISLHSLQVKAILVNIFGGIVNCATIANGIIKACKETKLSLPLIVRLEGE